MRCISRQPPFVLFFYYYFSSVCVFFIHILMAFLFFGRECAGESLGVRVVIKYHTLYIRSRKGSEKKKKNITPGKENSENIKNTHI